jgi:hypothetical protein
LIFELISSIRPLTAAPRGAAQKLGEGQKIIRQKANIKRQNDFANVFRERRTPNFFPFEICLLPFDFFVPFTSIICSA